MKYHSFTEEEIINKTKLAILYYFSRNMTALLELIDEKCVWIGAYDSQYIQGKKAFIKETQSESKELPSQILQEEYAILFHERKYSSVYGRFTVAGEHEGTVLLAKVRLTFIWKQIKNDLLAIHIHCSDSKDIPIQYENTKLQELSNNLGWFEYIRQIDTLSHQTERTFIRDIHGAIHTLMPQEILYIQSHNKESTVFTGFGSFITKYPLRELSEMCPSLIRVHRSYLVNPQYVKTIRRYLLSLNDETTIPIGKEKYMNVKKALSQ